MDWKKRQAECKQCRGFGYTASEAKHEDGRGPNAWAARCECQPHTMEELEEATAPGKEVDMCTCVECEGYAMEAGEEAERFFPFEFEVWQGDDMVASASGTRENALREAMHYAAQYEQDGPVRVFEVTRTLVRTNCSVMDQS